MPACTLIYVRFSAWGLALLVANVLVGCAAPVGPSITWDDFNASKWAQMSGLVNDAQTSAVPLKGGRHKLLLPGKKETTYLPAEENGRGILKVHAQSAASMLRQKIHVAPVALGKVRFSWKVTDLIAAADMGDRDLDDAPVRVVLAFDGDRSRFSAKNAMLSELTHALTGEPMPYAVMMYVWSKHRPIGTIIPSPRTDRIRKLVVETGSARLGQWVEFERDIQTDFERTFGEAPGALVAMGVMTDTDNTHATVDAAYGPLSVILQPKP